MRNFDWPGTPELHVLDSMESEEPVVVLDDRRVVEYLYNKNNELEMYVFYYNLVRINESKSVEDHNKIYIPVYDPEQLITFKARTISDKGLQNEMLRGEMKPVTEDGQLYMSLAIDGVEKGSEVEYFYSVRRGVSFESSENIQTKMLTRNVDVQIISPENLIFLAKIYNCDSAFTDTIISKKRIKHTHFSKVPAVFEENYANESATKVRIEYKLHKNLSQGSGNLLTYADAGKYYYNQLTQVEKNEEKDLEKAFAKLNTSSMGDEEKIRVIEGFLKTKFNNQDRADIKDLSDALKKNIANPYSINKMAVLMTKYAKVKYEIVLTINRYRKYFDPDFESWNYLDQVLIYYPGLDMYMMPTNDGSRLGEPPVAFIECDGLFIREIGLGDITSVVSAVKKLPEVKAGNHYDNMEVNIKFSPEMKSVEQHIKRSMAGHSNIGVRPFYFYSTPEKRVEMAETLMKYGIDDAKVTNMNVSNFNLNTQEVNKAFTLECDLSYASLLEKADNIYLFKVGEVIGQQTEMYQEKPRVNPIEIDFPHNLDRVIKIQIPDGYTAKGLEVLNKKIVGGDANNPTVGFITSYKITGNVLEIQIHEYYTKLRYPFDQYNQFRDVINASADFNKVTIAFEKKS